VVAAWPAMLRMRPGKNQDPLRRRRRFTNLTQRSPSRPQAEAVLVDGHQDGRWLREPDRVRRAGPRRLL